MGGFFWQEKVVLVKSLGERHVAKEHVNQTAAEKQEQEEEAEIGLEIAVLLAVAHGISARDDDNGH